MAKRTDWVDLYSRARWDRLAGAAVVLTLLLIAMVAMFRSCGKDDAEPASTDSGVVSSTEAATQPIVDNSRAIYLSPSTQYDNLYACDNTTTEAAAMIDLATRVKALLEADGYTVYMCGPEEGVKAKVDQGNSLKCGAYVSLHSNSGGESGSGQGTECFYNSHVSGSKVLAECVYNKMAALTPTEDRGLKDETQRDLYEISNNTTACCLLEVEFHDIADLSQWILDNQDASAQAIAEGIKAYMAIAETLPEETMSDTGETMAWSPEVVH